MLTLIYGGTIFTSSDQYAADILIEDEKIKLIGNNFPVPENVERIDATGLLILPGGIDVHTHFDLPMFKTVSSDDHYTGHKAAAFGGTTTVIDFVPQMSNSLLQDVDQWHAKADHKAAVDFSFHMNITRFNNQIAAEIPRLIGEGITTLKVFTAYNNTLRLNDGDIFKVMRIAAKEGFLTMMHAENGDVIEVLVEEALAQGHVSPVWHARTRPAWGAVEAVARGISFSAQSGAPLYIVHMNVAGEVDQLAYARAKGVQVMGETCPQYLLFTESNLALPDGAKWVCSPPMRSEADNRRLWQGLSDGTIQVLATDHCAFFYDGTQPIRYENQDIAIPGKELGKDDFTLIPNGLPGVGDRLPIFWTEGIGKRHFSINKFVELTATNPAKIFGLYPQKGTILPGSDADLVFWDADQQITYGTKWSQQRTDYNLYEGWHLEGYPRKVMLRGKIIMNQQEWLGKAGQGKFIKRSPFAPVM